MALEMVKYQTLVIMLFANHPPQHCLEYDRLFRQPVAQDTSLCWDTIKEDIYVWAITKKGSVLLWKNQYHVSPRATTWHCQQLSSYKTRQPGDPRQIWERNLQEIQPWLVHAWRSVRLLAHLLAAWVSRLAPSPRVYQTGTLSRVAHLYDTPSSGGRELTTLTRPGFPGCFNPLTKGFPSATGAHTQQLIFHLPICTRTQSLLSLGFSFRPTGPLPQPLAWSTSFEGTTEETTIDREMFVIKKRRIFYYNK